MYSETLRLQVLLGRRADVYCLAHVTTSMLYTSKPQVLAAQAVMRSSIGKRDLDMLSRWRQSTGWKALRMLICQL